MADTCSTIRVLVVDDDQMLGRLLLRFLSRASIAADQAASVAEARATFLPGVHSHVVVDLTLPDGSGATWLAETLAVDDDLVGVLASGYPVSPELLPPAVRHRASLLQKPFTPPELLTALGLPPRA
ncbi:MAG: response regulator [Acidobacteriota bacterium]